MDRYKKIFFLAGLLITDVRAKALEKTTESLSGSDIEAIVNYPANLRSSPLNFEAGDFQICLNDVGVRNQICKNFPDLAQFNRTSEDYKLVYQIVFNADYMIPTGSANDMANELGEWYKPSSVAKYTPPLRKIYDLRRACEGNLCNFLAP